MFIPVIHLWHRQMSKAEFKQPIEFSAQWTPVNGQRYYWLYKTFSEPLWWSLRPSDYIDEVNNTRP